jgi:hypothetical protein
MPHIIGNISECQSRLKLAGLYLTVFTDDSVGLSHCKES